MRGRMGRKEDEARARAEALERELAGYEAAGVPISVNGYEVEVNRRITQMLLREGPCTYMRSYSFDDNGKVDGISFDRVKL